MKCYFILYRMGILHNDTNYINIDIVLYLWYTSNKSNKFFFNVAADNDNNIKIIFASNYWFVDVRKL